ncbi:hypothetical protein GCM10023238_29700 [Streptomyces heliomycini]
MVAAPGFLAGFGVTVTFSVTVAAGSGSPASVTAAAVSVTVTAGAGEAESSLSPDSPSPPMPAPITRATSAVAPWVSQALRRDGFGSAGMPAGGCPAPAGGTGIGGTAPQLGAFPEPEGPGVLGGVEGGWLIAVVLRFGVVALAGHKVPAVPLMR